MMKSGLVVLMLLSLCAVAHSQDSKPPTNDACLEKEISDFTRPLFADGGRPKVGFLVEDITWSADYRKAATDVIQSRFASNFALAGDDTLGTLMFYISGTSAISNGAQFVSVRLQIDSSEIVLPQNGSGFNDLHLAKIGDPTRVMRGELVIAEDGVLLAPIEPGIPFELWHQLNIQKVRETVAKMLTEFLVAWDKAGKK